MPAFRQLFDLQTIDLEIEKHSTRLTELNTELGDRRSLDTVGVHVAKLTVAVDETIVRQRESEDTIASLTQRIDIVEARLYSGEVRNPRELEDLQEDIAQLGRQREEHEIKLLEILEDLEPRSAERNDISSRLKEAEDTWMVKQETLANEKAKIESELVAMGEQRHAAAEALPASELSLYETIRTRHPHGKGISRVHDSTCDTCRVGLPMRQVQELRTSSTPVRCPSCGLILSPE